MSRLHDSGWSGYMQEKTLRWFDTHAHYDDEKFSPQERDALLAGLFAGEVFAIMGAAVNLTSSEAQIKLAERFPRFYASVGIHPENINDEGNLPETIDVLRILIRHPKVKAIGEIGLDYYWESNPPKEVQKEWLDAQLSLAEEVGLPVIIHDREAHGDIFDLLTAHPKVTGVLHSCSASAEMAMQLVRRGWYISFSGVITYKNASRIAEVVKAIPDDRILVETDAPYLPPVPFRGKRNHSGLVAYTGRRAAELRGMPETVFARLTVENAKKCFRIEDKL